LFYRYDSIDLNTDIDDARDEVEHIVGMNYFIDEKIRLRAQYSFNQYDIDQGFQSAAIFCNCVILVV